jgi:hypothetical protein
MALATLAFASAITSGAAGTPAASAAPSRGTASPLRTPAGVARPAGSGASVSDRRDGTALLPPELDVTAFAAELRVHPGRLAAALRRLTPDESRSIDGRDPLTALALALDLPATDVYLAAARFAAHGSR